MSKRSLYATLIGINAYKQNSLNGCIKDVLDIDLLLRDQCRQQENDSLEYKPLYLLAPGEIDNMRIADYEAAQKLKLSFDAPTFKNISEKAFVHLKQSNDGDVCLLFYSGHGSQVDAPPEFWHTKPDRQNETIVCVDSRDPGNPDTRDVIDKELGYLLWDALKDKKVHCVVIMDCCHSGNNMRGAVADKTLRFRHIPSSKNKVPLEKYLGYDTNGNFYEIKNGKITGMLDDVAYQSNTQQFWNSCVEICDKDDYRSFGTFRDGKGQPSQVSAVSHGSSTSRFNNVNVINTNSSANI